MNQGDYFSKQFIIRSAIVILLISPIVGFLVASLTAKTSETLTLHPVEREKSDLLKTITNHQNEFADTVELKAPSVASVKRYNDMWYLVSVKGQYESGDTGEVKSGTTYAVVGDFRNNKDKMTLVMPPGGSLPYKDISDSMGVPYELLSELNTTEEKL